MNFSDAAAFRTSQLAAGADQDDPNQACDWLLQHQVVVPQGRAVDQAPMLFKQARRRSHLFGQKTLIIPQERSGVSQCSTGKALGLQLLNARRADEKNSGTAKKEKRFKEALDGMGYGSQERQKLIADMRANYLSCQRRSQIKEKCTNVRGDIQTRVYTLGPFLGKGGFARVYQLRDDATGIVYAAKIVNKSNLSRVTHKRKLLSEIKIHKQVSKHRNIVSFRHYFEDSVNVYMLLDLCVRGTLSEFVKTRGRLHELEVKNYTRQICEGLKFMHQRRVIHRDLKLSNLFLDDNMTVKIADFGLACKQEYVGQRRSTLCGTPNYIAPEMLSSDHYYSNEVDIWALGVIIYTMLVGKPPFQAASVKQTYSLIKENDWQFPTDLIETRQISVVAQDLVRRLLVKDPRYRLDLLDVENHPFLNGPVHLPRELCPSLLYCLLEPLLKNLQISGRSCLTRLELADQDRIQAICLRHLALVQGERNEFAQRELHQLAVQLKHELTEATKGGGPKNRSRTDGCSIILDEQVADFVSFKSLRPRRTDLFSDKDDFLEFCLNQLQDQCDACFATSGYHAILNTSSSGEKEVRRKGNQKPPQSKSKKQSMTRSKQPRVPTHTDSSKSNTVERGFIGNARGNSPRTASSPQDSNHQEKLLDRVSESSGSLYKAPSGTKRLPCSAPASAHRVDEMTAVQKAVLHQRILGCKNHMTSAEDTAVREQEGHDDVDHDGSLSGRKNKCNEPQDTQAEVTDGATTPEFDNDDNTKMAEGDGLAQLPHVNQKQHALPISRDTLKVDDSSQKLHFCFAPVQIKKENIKNQTNANKVNEQIIQSSNDQRQLNSNRDGVVHEPHDYGRRHLINQSVDKKIKVGNMEQMTESKCPEVASTAREDAPAKLDGDKVINRAQRKLVPILNLNYGLTKAASTSNNVQAVAQSERHHANVEPLIVTQTGEPDQTSERHERVQSSGGFRERRARFNLKQQGKMVSQADTQSADHQISSQQSTEMRDFDRQKMLIYQYYYDGEKKPAVHHVEQTKSIVTYEKTTSQRVPNKAVNDVDCVKSSIQSDGSQFRRHRQLKLSVDSRISSANKPIEPASPKAVETVNRRVDTEASDITKGLNQTNNVAEQQQGYTARNRQLVKAQKPAVAQGKNDEKFCPIVKWVDFKQKYGVGYILANGQAGMLYNDRSSMLSAEQSRLDFEQDDIKLQEDHVMYRVNSVDEQAIAVSSAHENPSLNKDIKKKVQLFVHFRQFLFTKVRKAELKVDTEAVLGVHLEQYKRTDVASLFKFGAKAAQIVFNDRSEVRVEGDVITYRSSRGVQLQCSPEDMESHKGSQFFKRFVYSIEQLKDAFNFDVAYIVRPQQLAAAQKELSSVQYASTANGMSNNLKFTRDMRRIQRFNSQTTFTAELTQETTDARGNSAQPTSAAVVSGQASASESTQQETPSEVQQPPLIIHKKKKKIIRKCDSLSTLPPSPDQQTYDVLSKVKSAVAIPPHRPSGQRSSLTNKAQLTQQLTRLTVMSPSASSRASGPRRIQLTTMHSRTSSSRSGMHRRASSRKGMTAGEKNLNHIKSLVQGVVPIAVVQTNQVARQKSHQQRVREAQEKQMLRMQPVLTPMRLVN